MAYYKDTLNTNPNLNGVHYLDTLDLERLLPITCVPITDAEGQAIEAAFEAAQALKVAAMPNPAAFIQACKTVIGIANLTVNTQLFQVVQLAMDAISQNQMADLQTIITSAHTNAIITQIQYDAIKAAAIQFNIPVTL